MASDEKAIGEIAWVDLTVPDAEELREFYSSVVGWEAAGFDMGDYHDYMINSPETKETVAGLCHAKGSNAVLPPCWLIYIKVANLDESLEACRSKGGELIAGPRSFGAARYCVLKDPAGAAFAIIEGNAGGAE